MDINQILMLENIEKLKGVVGTILAFGGFDIISGMLSNKKVQRVSYLLNLSVKLLRKFSVLFARIADTIQKVQDYGGEIKQWIE